MKRLWLALSFKLRSSNGRLEKAHSISFVMKWHWVSHWPGFHLSFSLSYRPFRTGCYGTRPKLARPGQPLTSTLPTWNPWRCLLSKWDRWEWNPNRLKSCFEWLSQTTNAPTSIHWPLHNRLLLYMQVPSLDFAWTLNFNLPCMWKRIFSQCQSLTQDTYLECHDWQGCVFVFNSDTAKWNH